jgi:hypothetical protein
MADFNELIPEAGVDGDKRYIAVPLNGVNFFRLQNLAGCQFGFYKDSLQITPLTRQSAITFSHMVQQQYKDLGLKEDGFIQALWGAIHATSGNQSHSQLYVISGKVKGIGEVKIIHKSNPKSLYVNVLPKKSFKLAFKFLSYLDDAGTMKSMTKWTPSDAQQIVDSLNEIYGPQANISFTVSSADQLSINQQLGNPMSSKVFLNRVVQSKNANVDLNIFFLDGWEGGKDAGSYFHDVRCAAVESAPTRSEFTEGSDTFIVNLAHEIAHFLQHMQADIQKIATGGDGHLDKDPNVLMSSKIQSSKINRNLIAMING